MSTTQRLGALSTFMEWLQAEYSRLDTTPSEELADLLSEISGSAIALAREANLQSVNASLT